MIDDSSRSGAHRRVGGGRGMVWAALLGVAGLAVMTRWWPVTRVGLLGDDFEIARSVETRGPLGMWCGDASGLFRPVASISAWFDSRFLSDSSYAHLHSLFLYGVSALAVGLLARTLRLEHPWLAGVVFLAFGNHAEPVGWLAARGDLLVTIFSVLALCACLSRRGGGSVWMYALAALALLSKESAIVLAPLAGVLLFWSGHAGRGGAWRLLELLAVTLAWLVLRSRVIGEWIGGYGAESIPRFRWATVQRLGEYFAATFGVYVSRTASTDRGRGGQTDPVIGLRAVDRTGRSSGSARPGSASPTRTVAA